MSAHHGNTPAAWTFVVVFLVGFTISSAALMLGPNWPLFWIGVVIATAVAAVVGKVMQKMGYGAGA